ncbi:hypothetical protein PSACC_02773 [Paramicrosporidium saccamoebae]|uniref:GATA-type domain-containing protein n=1 Tax=Paramicrosporidium saccamoebae TaxID=1246581 RepID=A0A2H9TI27_9FUNG|nr:hypothetical protein PSACC_02773 [Paramicrosporidium saccamoebae]
MSIEQFPSVLPSHSENGKITARGSAVPEIPSPFGHFPLRLLEAVSLMTVPEGKNTHVNKVGVSGYSEDTMLIDMAMPVATHPAFWALAMEEAINSSLSFPQRASSAPAKPITEGDTIINVPPQASSLNGDMQSWMSSPGRICQNCHTTQTPFWRRAMEGFFCNACGLYLRAHKKMRPITLQLNRCSKRMKTRADICSNCHATETPLWRRIVSGETVCNACGLYYKLHGSHRAVDMTQNGIPILRGAGKKPRALLPKYTMESAWHQYYPPVLPRGPQMQQQTQPASQAQQPRVGLYNENSKAQDAPVPLGMDFVQYAMMTSNNAAAAAAALFLPFGGFPRENGPAPNAMLSKSSTVDGSLDDSMRWFSSTCLETAFANPE